MNQSFITEALESHNNLRIKHGAPPLILCQNLCQSSEKYAKKLAKLEILKSSTNSSVGQNILTNDENISGKLITQIWYNEIKNINYSNLEDSEFCDNFTQIIWVDSKKFGIGKYSKNGFIYVVAKYWPPGNFIGMYNQNIFPENSSIKIRSDFDYITSINVLNNKIIKKKMTKYINLCRNAHSAPNLKWKENIVNVAFKLADHILNNIDNALKQFYCSNSSNLYGRIVLHCEKGLPSFKKICKIWYSCINDYSFSNGCFSENTGSFTQLVWKETKTFGIGISNIDSQFLVVACFEPPGNIIGKFDDNVKPYIPGKKLPFYFTLKN